MNQDSPDALLANLQAAAASSCSYSKTMSETARLRHILKPVESALAAGLKRQAVLEILHEHGSFKMTMESFKSALRRIRQEEKK